MPLTKYPNGVESYVIAKNATVISGNTSVVVGDSGKEYRVTAAAIVQLPSISAAAGATYKFVLDVDGVAFAVGPSSGQGIAYANSGTVDKDLQLATSVKGDYVVLNAFQGGTWQVTACRGTWTKEA